LSDFPGELGDLLDVQHDIERLHRQLRPTETLSWQTIGSLRDRLLALTEEVFAAPLPVQALHGDVSLSNLLITNRGLVWNDFEDTFRGPLQWDVASFAVSLRDRGADSAFVAGALDSYGWADERELAPFKDAQEVYGEIWRLYVSQRRL
jgi:Ser/Thr protein kinase RdoA (MazF antagonist)